jgi:HAD superfamily hydrolase (TIGR01459 family)
MAVERVAGLKAVAGSYDALICDIWGVLHNGVAAFPPAVEALQMFRRSRGPVLLLTNAPRPAHLIRDQLRMFGVPDDAYDDLLTSGDVTRAVLAERPGAKVFHIGPDRDLPFYDGLDIALAREGEAELVSCTGLNDDVVETPEDYRALLSRLASRGIVMACANPDIVVERGDRLIYCAGALANLYTEIGGRAVLAGKPHPPIYRSAREALDRLGGGRVLAVGDGLPTDVRGAVDAGLDLLFVTGGIHEADFGPRHDPDRDRVNARLAAEGLTAVGFLPALAWDGAGRP